MARTLVISDLHLKHQNMLTYCQRPENFTELIVKNYKELVGPEDTVINLGDVGIGKFDDWKDIIPSLPGKKILVRGNHDKKSCDWYVSHAGFDFACDGLIYRGVWLTHKPAESLPEGCQYNIFGHLHNIRDGFNKEGVKVAGLKYPWQRLFALEYTDYKPIEFNEFLAHPQKYQATGPKKI